MLSGWTVIFSVLVIVAIPEIFKMIRLLFWVKALRQMDFSALKKIISINGNEWKDDEGIPDGM